MTRELTPQHHAIEPLRAEERGLLACVHCGFCLNACPTYTRLGHEADSPRGRLDLMRAVVEGRLAPEDDAFRTHIDQCLGCRACEPVCPSGVPYGFLLERARTAIARSAGISASTRLLIAAFTGPLRHIAGPASRAFRRTGLPRLLARALPGRLPSLRFALAMLAATRPWDGRRAAAPAHGKPPAAPSASGTRPPGPADAAGGAAAADVDVDVDVAGDVATDPERGYADPHALAGGFPAATGAATGAVTGAVAGAVAGEAAGPVRQRTVAGPRHAAGRAGPARPRVGVLRGCVQHALLGHVSAATERVLERNGYAVTAVPGQRCCGALDAHAGRLDRALALARVNIAAFEAAGVERVVVDAAGCGAMMKEYGEQLRHDDVWVARAASFSARVRDAAELLMERGVRPGGALPVRVTYDAPCHLHHGQRIRQAPLDLLDAIPGLERVPLPDADECCGGAGLYGVHHPELGGHILGDKIAAIRSTGAELVATPNPGCMMQIGAGLLLAGESVGVVHPLELLDESYRREEEGG